MLAMNTCSSKRTELLEESKLPKTAKSRTLKGKSACERPWSGVDKPECPRSGISMSMPGQTSPRIGSTRPSHLPILKETKISKRTESSAKAVDSNWRRAKTLDESSEH